MGADIIRTHCAEALMHWHDLWSSILTGLLEQLPSAVLVAGATAAITQYRRRKNDQEQEEE